MTASSPCSTDALATAREQIGQVKRLTADNPTQQARVLALEAQLDAIEWRLTRTAAVRKEQGFDAAREIVLAGESRKQIDDLPASSRRWRARNTSCWGTDSRSPRPVLHHRRDRRTRRRPARTCGRVAFIWLLHRHPKARARAAAAVLTEKEHLHASSPASAMRSSPPTPRPRHLPERRGRVADRLDERRGGRASRSTWCSASSTRQTRQPVENPALRALREGAVVGLANHTVLIARDGTERPDRRQCRPDPGRARARSSAACWCSAT